MAKHSIRDAAPIKDWCRKRKASLEKARLPFESSWRDTRLYYEPYLGKCLIEGDPDERVAQGEDQKIINSTPRILLHRMAAGLQSGITSQARQWFRLRCRDKKLSEMSSVRRWLDQTSEAVNDVFTRSNVYPALDQVYLHLGLFGTAAAIAYADDETDMHVQVVDEGAYWIAENRRGRVDTLLRRMDMTVASMLAEFGEGWLPAAIVERAKAGRLEERVVVWNLVAPNDARSPALDSAGRDRPFSSIYWTDGHDADANGGVLDVRSFGYNPIIAPRWFVFGSAYGIGCGQIGLPDAKQLQVMELDKLKVIESEVDPAMAAPASMKDEPISTGPGGITYFPDNAGNRPVGRLFETRQQLQAILLGIEATEHRLERTFYSDLFALMMNLNLRPKTMTAREVSELSAEKIALLGPILTRLNTDMLDPLVDAGFAIAAQRGIIGQAPEAIAGQDLVVEYVSSLHMEQQAATRLNGLMRITEFAGALSQFNPNAMDKLDTDEMIDVAAATLVEHGVVRDDKVVAQIRESRAAQQREAQQQAAQQQAVATGARAAKDLSQARLGNGSALDAMVEEQP